MKRRSVIKSIGLGMGVTVTAGTFTALLQGCGSDKTSAVAEVASSIWSSPNDVTLLQHMVDAILPATDIPSASEVGVVDFVTSVVGDLYTEDQRSRFKQGLALTKAEMEQTLSTTTSKLTGEQVTGYLEGLLGASADAATYEKMLDLSRKAPTDVAVEEQDTYKQYSFLHALKSMTVNGFCQSEYVGEEVLQYVPVPGPYNGHLEYAGEKVYSMS